LKAIVSNGNGFLNALFRLIDLAVPLLLQTCTNNRKTLSILERDKACTAGAWQRRNKMLMGSWHGLIYLLRKPIWVQESMNGISSFLNIEIRLTELRNSPAR